MRIRPVRSIVTAIILAVVFAAGASAQRFVLLPWQVTSESGIMGLLGLVPGFRIYTVHHERGLCMIVVRDESTGNFSTEIVPDDICTVVQ